MALGRASPHDMSKVRDFLTAEICEGHKVRAEKRTGAPSSLTPASTVTELKFSDDENADPTDEPQIGDDKVEALMTAYNSFQKFNPRKRKHGDDLDTVMSALRALHQTLVNAIAAAGGRFTEITSKEDVQKVLKEKKRGVKERFAEDEEDE